ncbi:MAG: hypothetical protein EPN40_07820, partial [Rhodanobacteraceae bacterium]
PSADGARLVQLDRDHRYMVERNGYIYKVIERSWALIPQRSGAIGVQGPEFQGQQMALGNPGTWLNNPNALPGNPNALLNGQVPGFGKPVGATAPVVRIDARAAPANAGKPWLPARNVELKLTGLSANGEVNAAAPLTITLAISASGQPADALPQPELPPIAGARVYPDQTQDATDDSGQWLRGSRTRSFAIVPDRNGDLKIPAITLDWWDVVHDRAEQASLPARTLRVSGVMINPTVAPAAPAASIAAGGSVVASQATTAPGPRGGVVTEAPASIWRNVSLGSLALWILVVVAAGAWWWRRRPTPVPLSGEGDDGHRGDAGGGSTSSRVDQRVTAATEGEAKQDAGTLQRKAVEAARTGDGAACEHALLAWARATHPAIVNAGALRDALSDPVQREALDALQRARWQGGDAAPACTAVAQAFAKGFAWRDGSRPARVRESDLPPLYPS